MHTAGIAAGAIVALGWVAGAQPTTAVPPYTALKLDSPAPEAQPAGQGGGFGVRMGVIGDLNKDGANDVFVATAGQDVAGLPAAGRVWVIDGAKRAVLATFDDPFPQAGAWFGLSSAALGDVDGDGYPDLAVAAVHQDVGGNVDEGELFVYSGHSGKLLYARKDSDPQPGAEFGRTVLSPGDLNGDGVPDLLVGAPRQDEGSTTKVGRVYALSGKDGSLLYKVRAPDVQHNARFGLGIADPGDLNGDGVDDFVVGAPKFDDSGVDAGRAYVFSGKTGTLLRTLRDPLPQGGAQFGFMNGARGAPGDVNGDGTPDVLVPAIGHDASGLHAAGLAFIFSGKDGTVLRTLADPTPAAGGAFGFAYAGAGDVNHDGVSDTIVGQAPFLEASADPGGAYIFDGKSGSLLASLQDPAGQTGSDMGASLASPGDVNHDAHPDYFVGGPLVDVGANADQGEVIAFESRDTSAPSTPTARRTGGTRKAPRYTFSSSDADNPPAELSFRCSFDSTHLHPCRNPYAQRLRPGTHRLRVKALDPAGNGSPVRVIRVVTR